MKIKLSKLPTERVKGIYTINGVKGRMPDRALFMHPEAADAFLTHLSEFVVVSDMLRSADESLHAVKTKAGTKPPGYSAHGFGMAVDIDTDATRKNIGLKNKEELDNWMADRGFFCHRVDHKLEIESWHSNHLGIGFKVPAGAKNTAGCIEDKIVEMYGDQFKLTNEEIQTYLQSLKLYSGGIDGKLGPLSKTAITVFQNAWNLQATGLADARTQRTLAFVTAEKDIV